MSLLLHMSKSSFSYYHIKYQPCVFTGAHVHRYNFLFPHKVSTQSLYWCTCFLFGNKKHFYKVLLVHMSTGPFSYYHIKYQPVSLLVHMSTGTFSYYHIKYQPCVFNGAHFHRFIFLLPHKVSILCLYWCTRPQVHFLITT